MGQLAVDIKPFLNDGSGYAADYIDVSDYVSANIGNIRQSLDLTDLDLGVLRNSSISIEVDNTRGTFNDVDDTVNSIFRYKRAGSLVRLSWRENERRAITGFSQAGSFVNSQMTPKQTVFEGLLSDEDFSFNAIDQLGSFTVLGKESVLDQVSVSTSDFNNGDPISDVMYAILNKTAITDLLTVSAANINPTTDQTIDDKDELSGNTVREALKTLLTQSNSVLRIVDDAIIIGPRTISAASVKTFYNQSSTSGAENLIKIESIRSGLKRTFNLLQWSNTTTEVSDATSIAKYGVRKKELGTALITTPAKQTAILTSILNEFATPRQSFDLTIPITYENLDIDLLDRITIDYAPLITGEFGEIPICGEALCGSSILPAGLYNFVLTTEETFEIVERRVNFRGNTIVFSLRKVV